LSLKHHELQKKMSEPVLRALLIKPGGITRIATVTKTEGVVYLNYASHKLMSGGKLVSLSTEGSKCSQPRRLTDSELKQIHNVKVDGQAMVAKSCFDLFIDGRYIVLIAM